MRSRAHRTNMDEHAQPALKPWDTGACWYLRARFPRWCRMSSIDSTKNRDRKTRKEERPREKQNPKENQTQSTKSLVLAFDAMFETAPEIPTNMCPVHAGPCPVCARARFSPFRGRGVCCGTRCTLLVAVVWTQRLRVHAGKSAEFPPHDRHWTNFRRCYEESALGTQKRRWSNS